MSLLLLRGMNLKELYIQRCLDLSKLGVRAAMPNPCVGAVIVCNGKIIGEGYTSPYGGNHAEVNAINSVTDKALLKDATLFVSLEPCAHYGKTPPCANLVIESKIPRVVIGMSDPFSEVNGKGIKLLTDAGIQVEVGVLEDKCNEINKRFFCFHKNKRPYIILKWAQSPNGFIDIDRSNNEKGVHWITQPETKWLTHKWRTEEHAILVGTNTAINDNPALTARNFKGPNPKRILIDKSLKISTNQKIFNKDSETIILNQLKSSTENNIRYFKINFNGTPKPILDALYEENILSVIIEGGANTLNSFIENNIWDEARILTGKDFINNGTPAPLMRNTSLDRFNFGLDTIDIYRNA